MLEYLLACSCSDLMQEVTTAVTSWVCWSCRVWKTLVCGCPPNLWLFWSFHISFCDSPWLWGGLWQWCPTYSQLSTALMFMLNTWTSYEFLREPPSTVQQSLCTEDWGWRRGHREMNLDDSLLSNGSKFTPDLWGTQPWALSWICSLKHVSSSGVCLRFNQKTLSP